MADAQAGAAACKEAITILENFYGNASTAEVNTTELLQRPTEESRPGPGSDTGVDMQGAYKGDQSGAGSVIGMLDARRAGLVEALRGGSPSERRLFGSTRRRPAVRRCARHRSSRSKGSAQAARRRSARQATSSAIGPGLTTIAGGGGGV